MHRQAGSVAVARQSDRLPRGSVRSCAAIVTICLLVFVAGAQARITGYSGDPENPQAGPFLIAFERSNHLMTVPDMGGQPQPLTITNARANATEADPSWGFPLDACPGGGTTAPENRTLVYESRAPGTASDIMFATVTGAPQALSATEHNITDSQSVLAEAADPAVGMYLVDRQTPVVAFTAGTFPNRQLMVRSPDLAATVPLRTIAGTGDVANPDWAADGTSIAYDTPGPGGVRQIAIVPIEANPLTHELSASAAPRFVTAGPLPHTHPSRFDYVGHQAPHLLLYATTYPDLGLDYLDFLRHDADATGPLFTPDANPAPAQFGLTGDPGGDAAPDLQPDGRGAVFQSTRDEPGNVDIYRVALDGTDLLRLTTAGGDDLAPDWEPWTQQLDSTTSPADPCLEPLPGSPDPGPPPTRNGRPAQAGGAASSSGEPGVTEPARPPSPPAPRGMSVRRVHVRASGKGRRRMVVVTLIVDRRATARLRLTRGSKLLTRRTYALHSGGNRLRLAVPRKVKQGRCRLTITVRSAPFTRTIVRTVQLGR